MSTGKHQRRSRLHPALPAKLLTGLLALLMLVASACSLDSLAESAVETAVERAVEAETGEDVDLDFSDGSISVESDGGQVKFDTETGQFVVVDENGEVIEGAIGMDGDALTIDSTEGDVRFDAETGEFTAVGEDGEIVTGTLNEEDGTFDMDIENAEGEESSVRMGVDLADDWPVDILPIYPNATVESATQIDDGGNAINMMTFLTDDSIGTVADWYNDRTADWEGSRAGDSNGNFMFLTKDGWSAQILVAEQGPSTHVALTIGKG